MRKAILVSILIALLLIGALLLFRFESKRASLPRTLVVPDNYPTIQEAINAANPKDTVHVRAGTYRENVVVNKTVQLIGDNQSSTTINGEGLGSTIKVEASNVVIRGLRVINSSDQYLSSGIFLEHTENVSITSNNVTDNQGLGICIVQGVNNTINANAVTYNAGSGLEINGSAMRTLVADDIIRYNQQDGVLLYQVYDVSIVGNTISNNMKNGVTMKRTSQNTIIRQNTITYNLLNGVAIEEFSNNDSISQNFIIGNSEFGACFNSSNNEQVDKNVFYNDGLYVWNSSKNTVNSNTVNGKPLVYFESASNQDTTNAGQVILVNCTGMNVEGLNLSNTDFGLELCRTRNTTIASNEMENDLYGFVISNSSGNSIYHNSFIGNRRAQVYTPANAMQSINTWDNDYPLGGNYWSNYCTGADSYSGPLQNEPGSDGIVDTPFAVDSNNTDHYPLKNPWNAPPNVIYFNMTPSAFSPNGNGLKDNTTIEGSFSTLVDWQLRVITIPPGSATERSWSNKSRTFSIVWDGRDSSNALVADGVYQIILSGTDLNGRSFSHRPKNVTIDTTPPIVTVTSVSPNPFNATNGETTRINYTLSEPCTVTIKICQGSVLKKTLLNNIYQTAGAQSVVWDGTNNAGTQVKPGTFTIEIYVADEAGNQAFPYPITESITAE